MVGCLSRAQVFLLHIRLLKETPVADGQQLEGLQDLVDRALVKDLQGHASAFALVSQQSNNPL